MPYLAPLPPGRVLSTFGGLLALVEALNAVGVALASNPSSASSQQELGSRLILAAIGIQLGVIAVFAAIAAVFHRRCAGAGVRAAAVRVPLAALYASTALILARCVYRLVEHLGNTAVDLADPASLRSLSPVLRHEAYFYVFEAALMLLNSALWNVWNPGRYLPRSYHVHLAEDGRTEVRPPARGQGQGEEEEEEDADDRPLLAKVAHVFTFGIFFRRKRAQFRPARELNNYPVAENR